MPLNFGVSKEDMMRSKVVQPGWYLASIKNIEQGPGKNDPSSLTTTISLLIEDGPDKGAIGVPLTYWLSEKAAGLAVAFLEAAAGKKLPETGGNFDLEKAIGKKIKVYVKNDKFRDRLTNVCVDFQAAA